MWYGAVSYTHLDVYKRQILVLLFTVAVPLIRSAAMGYQASPEALIEGLNIALQEQDDELFASLMSKNLSLIHI